MSVLEFLMLIATLPIVPAVWYGCYVFIKTLYELNREEREE